jgi:hypothetical protein
MSGKSPTNAAGTHSDYPFRFCHLVVDPPEPCLGLQGDRAGDHQDIGVPRASLEEDPEPFHVEARGEGRDELDIAGIAGSGIEDADPGGFHPRPCGEAVGQGSRGSGHVLYTL